MLLTYHISKPCYKLTGKKDKQTQARMSSAAMIISYRQGLTSSCSESGWAEPTSPGTWSDRDRYLPVPASPCFTPGDRLGQALATLQKNELYRLNACRGHAPLSEPASAGAKTNKSYQRPRAAKQFFCRSFSHFPFLQPPEQAQKIIRKKVDMFSQQFARNGRLAGQAARRFARAGQQTRSYATPGKFARALTRRKKKIIHDT